MVHVHADHTIGVEPASALRHLFDRDLTRVAQYVLLGTGTAADDITDAGRRVTEDIGRQDIHP